MANKTLYVRNPHIWERASKLLRFNEDITLSQFIEEQLKMVVEVYDKEITPQPDC